MIICAIAIRKKLWTIQINKIILNYQNLLEDSFKGFFFSLQMTKTFYTKIEQLKGLFKEILLKQTKNYWKYIIFQIILFYLFIFLN